MKKALALILALALCVGVLAGCQQTPAETTKPTETTKPAETTAPTETTAATDPAPEVFSFEGKKLDVWTEASEVEGTLIDDLIKKTLGLDVTFYENNDSIRLSTLSEEVTPSVVWGYRNTQTADWNEYGRYGAYVNFMDYQELLPNFFARFNAPENAKVKAEAMLSEDELYRLPIFVQNTSRQAWLYRDDIFKAQNLEIPTDWESFLDVCRKLKAAYPESYPVTFRNFSGNLNALGEMAQQWGVNYRTNTLALDFATGKYYDSNVTDEMRGLIKSIRQLIEEDLMDIATLSYDTAAWQESLASGKSFITFEQMWHMDNLLSAGQELNPDFSLSWFKSIPMVESDLPYASRMATPFSYNWAVTTRCPDIELAIRYLDWLYSDEAVELLCWGVKGETYDVDENGRKYYLETADTSRFAASHLVGYCDPNATLASYSEKCAEAILGAYAFAQEVGWGLEPTLVYTSEEQGVINTYKQAWLDNRNAYLQNFLLGKLDINSDDDWNAFKQSEIDYNIEGLIAAYDAAYARQAEGKK